MYGTGQNGQSSSWQQSPFGGTGVLFVLCVVIIDAMALYLDGRCVDIVTCSLLILLLVTMNPSSFHTPLVPDDRE